MTFSEYVQYREGLWLNDKNALPGMSKLNSLPTRATPRKAKPVAPLRAVVPKAPTVGSLAVGYKGSPAAAGNVGSTFVGVPASQRS